MMTDSFSIWHGFGVLFFWAVFLVPLWRIISKAGYSGAWALVSLIPFVNIIALWIFAFARWPNEGGGHDEGRTARNVHPG